MCVLWPEEIDNENFCSVVEHKRVEMQKCTHMFKRARAVDARWEVGMWLITAPASLWSLAIMVMISWANIRDLDRMMNLICAAAQVFKVLVVVIGTVASELGLFPLPGHMIQRCVRTGPALAWWIIKRVRLQMQRADSGSLWRHLVLFPHCNLLYPRRSSAGTRQGHTHTAALLPPFGPQINELKYQQMGGSQTGDEGRGWQAGDRRRQKRWEWESAVWESARESRGILQ